MSDFFSFNEDSAKSADGFTKITTGIYDATIETVSTRVAGTGTQGVDYALMVNGNRTMIYGCWTRKKDGTVLLDGNKLNALMGILGIKSLTAKKKTIKTHNGDKEVESLVELEGKKIKVALQIEHDFYNEVRENIKIHTFFSEDGLTYGEKSSGAKDGKKIKYLTENLKDSQSKSYKEYMANVGDEDTSGEEESSGSLLG